MDGVRMALGKVSLAEHDVVWPSLFLGEQTRLTPILPQGAKHLQHFGSTAVPGLEAKPIIDTMPT